MANNDELVIGSTLNESLPGWGQLNTSFAKARQELQAESDERTSSDADAYLLRVMTQHLNDACLQHLFKQGGLSKAIPTKGGPNPDYMMYHAGIDTTRRYQLKGWLNDSERVAVGLYGVSAEGVLFSTGSAVFDPDTAQPDGQFTLEMAEALSGVGTLNIKAGTRLIMIRVLHRNTQGQPCFLTLNGGETVGDLVLAGGSAEHAVSHVGRAILRDVRHYLRWTKMTSANTNCLSLPPANMVDEVNGEPDTNYYLGSYDLQQGECLEVLLPSSMPGYWSLHAYNHWCEALPNASVDDLTAITDADGNIRIGIGPTLTANKPNTINTLGRDRGALILRIIGAQLTQPPQTKVR